MSSFDSDVMDSVTRARSLDELRGLGREGRINIGIRVDVDTRGRRGSITTLWDTIAKEGSCRVVDCAEADAWR